MPRMLWHETTWFSGFVQISPEPLVSESLSMMNVTWSSYQFEQNIILLCPEYYSYNYHITIPKLSSSSCSLYDDRYKWTDMTSQWSHFLFSFVDIIYISRYLFTGHLRNQNWRYLPYIRPIFQAYVREYFHKIWPYNALYGTNVPLF